MTVYNANHLGVKAIAKRAAKDTGRALVEDMSGAETRVQDQEKKRRKEERGEEQMDVDVAGNGQAKRQP